MKWLKIFGVLCCILTISVFYWHNTWPYRGWKRYTSSGKEFSFSYPPSWVINECGNGEVVLARAKVQECYYPDEAPSDYLDKLYFQVFLPGKSLVSLSPVKPSEKLTRWKSLSLVQKGFFMRYYPIGTPGIIYSPTASRSAELKEQNKYALLGSLNIGYVDDTSRISLEEKILFIKSVQVLREDYTYNTQPSLITQPEKYLP